MPATVYVFEGSWDRPNEAPQVLPYFNAYEQTFRDVRVNHRTIRNKDDLTYYLRKIPRNARAFVCIACHGEIGYLDPSDKKSQIYVEDLQIALNAAKEGSIAFLHFGSCLFLQPEEGSRRAFLAELLESMTGAVWVSGYTKRVDWLKSMLLDLAFISEVYIPWYQKPGHRVAAAKNAKVFFGSYEQLARSLGFSALSAVGKTDVLLPHRLSK